MRRKSLAIELSWRNELPLPNEPWPLALQEPLALQLSSRAQQHNLLRFNLHLQKGSTFPSAKLFQHHPTCQRMSHELLITGLRITES